MKVSFQIKGNGLNALANVLSETPKKLPRELASIANKVAKGHRKEIGKEIRKHVVMKSKAVLKYITQDKIATKEHISTNLFIRGNKRSPLKDFGAKQTKKGVSYRISKKHPRKTVNSAFGPKIPRLGNHVFLRKGKNRLPIRKLYGPSMLAVYLKNDLRVFSVNQLSDEMGKQVNRRVRAIIVNQIKKQGRAEGISTETLNQRIQTRFQK